MLLLSTIACGILVLRTRTPWPWYPGYKPAVAFETIAYYKAFRLDFKFADILAVVPASHLRNNNDFT
jgi:hypothetical protein